MKFAMHTTTEEKVQDMCTQSTPTLLQGIDGLVEQLVTLNSQASEIISKHSKNVYSICWDDQSEQSKNHDPELQRKVSACRDALLPDLNQLCADLAKVQDKMGIERETLDLDVVAVQSLDNTIRRMIEEALQSGEIIDLCDSDEELDAVPSKLPPTKKMAGCSTLKIKADPGNEYIDTNDLGVVSL